MGRAGRAALKRLEEQPALLRFGVGAKIVAVPLLVCLSFGVVLWFLSAYLNRIQNQTAVFEVLAELSALGERTGAIASNLERPVTAAEMNELAASWRSKAEELRRVALASGYDLSELHSDLGRPGEPPAAPKDELETRLSEVLQATRTLAKFAANLARQNAAERNYSRLTGTFQQAAGNAIRAVNSARDLARTRITGAAKEANSLVLGALLLTIFLGLGAGIWVSRSLSARVMQLSAVAEQLAAGHLSRRAPVTSQDELGLLAQTLNEMARRLEAAQAQLRATSVSRKLVGQILKDLGDQMREPMLAMYNTGGRLAEKLSGSLEERLQAFRQQGLGELELASEQPVQGELTFHGRGLFQAMTPSSRQADDFARGFLARTVELLAGVSCNCEELACQATGDAECVFVVYPLEDTDRPALVALLGAVAE